MFTKDFYKKYGVYILTMLAWAIIVALVPYGCDDWTWGSEEGIIRLKDHFYDYNGRYLGNCIIIALMRSPVLRVVVMSVFNTSIPIFIEKITKVKINYCCSLLLFFVMNAGIWSMTAVWTSGFANYITSACFTLAFLVYVFRVIGDKNEKKSSIKLSILFIFLGLANTLIVEHMTIYNIILSIFVLIYVYKKEKKLYIQDLVYFISCVTGAAIMFSNKSYRRIRSEDALHNMGADFLTQIKFNYFNTIYKYAFSYNMWINVSILLLLYIIFKKNNDLFTNKSKKLLNVYAVYVAWSFIGSVGLVNSYTKKLVYLDGVLALIGFICLISLLIRVFWKTPYRVHMIFLLASCLLHCGILLRIQPVQERCFLMIYVLWIVLVGFMIKYIYENNYVDKKVLLKTKKCVFVVIGLLTFFYMSIYYVMSRANSYRIDSIHTNVKQGEKVVYVKELPFKDYFIGARYDIGGYDTFKDFYGIPEDIVIIQYEAANK